jgi:DNA-binding response OmpR family regulator
MTETILLVEDDRTARDTMEHTLVAQGYAVDASATVAEACACLEESPYDLAVIDLLLPDGSGMTVADRAARRGVKVVIVTGYAFRIPAAELERHDYLLKPLRPAELVREVERRLRVGA